MSKSSHQDFIWQQSLVSCRVGLTLTQTEKIGYLIKRRPTPYHIPPSDVVFVIEPVLRPTVLRAFKFNISCKSNLDIPLYHNKFIIFT